MCGVVTFLFQFCFFVGGDTRLLFFTVSRCEKQQRAHLASHWRFCMILVGCGVPGNRVEGNSRSILRCVSACTVRCNTALSSTLGDALPPPFQLPASFGLQEHQTAQCALFLKCLLLSVYMYKQETGSKSKRAGGFDVRPCLPLLFLPDFRLHPSPIEFLASSTS